MNLKTSETIKATHRHLFAFFNKTLADFAELQRLSEHSKQCSKGYMFNAQMLLSVVKVKI